MSRFFLVVCLFVAPLFAEDPMSPSSLRTVRVAGHGSAAAVPDMVTIQCGVTNLAPSAKAALSANSVAMQEVFQLLKARGVADKDVQTSGFQVFPEYRRQRREEPQREISGYRVTNTVTVKLRDLDQLGDTLDALVSAGSNQIAGIQFGFSDPESLLRAARKDAVRDAKARAELYAAASAAGRLGRVLSLSEQPETPTPAYRGRAMMMDMAAESVPVAAGEQEVSSVIHVTYELVD